jgi:hypothetical protein
MRPTITEPIQNITLLQEYIKALIVNINHTQLPKNINVIFDGGVFNGGFAAGIALYLKSMEDHQLINIHHVSGCSIGSVLAVWYLTGCEPRYITYFEKCMTSYKTELNLRAFKAIVQEFINDIFLSHKKTEAELIAHLNGRLFITYYNVKIHKQKTVSKFRDKAHIIDCIFRSSHVPYLIDGRPSYKKKYMDGITPYIFKNRLPNLFIRLMTFNKCTRAFMIKSENNIHYRLLTGIADVNEFFTTGSADMCSFVGDWSYGTIIQLRVREIICFLIFSLIGWLIIIKTYLPQQLTDSLLYNGTLKAIQSLYLDLVGRILV